MIVEQVIRHYTVAIAAGFWQCVKRLRDIKVTIVVSQFLARIDIPYCELKIVSCRDAVGTEAMVYKTCVIPAENVVALVIAVSVFIEEIPEERFHILDLLRSEDLIKGIEGPGDSALRDELGGYHSHTYFRAYEL
jgi:hypothetical protein